MNDPLIMLGVVEVILFLVCLELLSGSRPKKSGIVLMITWGLVLVVTIIWGLARTLA